METTTAWETDNMASLGTLVRGYLTSAGFRILEEQANCLIADKLVFGQDRDTWLVWTVPEETEPSLFEPALRGSITAIRSNYPAAKACFVAPSRGGYSRDLLTYLAESRVNFLVPVWFFDAPFKFEEAPKAVSAIADIRAQAATQNRVPQPFRSESDTGGAHGDLFDLLLSQLATPKTSTVRVVVGRAGIGKSILFRALFDRLYGDFLSAKQQHRTMPRPIPLVPEHLKGTYALRTEALLDNFLRTDVAAPVGRETFEWLLVNGFATWFLDGLDELYAGDPGFFDYLLDLVTRPDSKAQITIWCRDSLLTTSDAFAEFRDFCGSSTDLQVYRLSEWERPSKRIFAWLGFEGRRPKPDEHDSGQVRGFLTAIDGNDTLRSLSGLPFYCELLLQQHKAGTLRAFSDDVALLNHVVDKMVEREVGKGLIDLRLFEANGLNDWLDQISIEYVEGRYGDINCDQAMQYAELVLRADLDNNTRQHILTTLLQFPLFRAGDKTGLIGFTHDLIAQTLAARGYARLLPKRAREVADRLAGVDLEDPTLLRFMANRLDQASERSLIEELRRGNLCGKSFPVALSLLLLARPDRDLVKRIGPIRLDGQDLVAVHFVRRDLSSVSFRSSDLSSAMFADCDLRGAFFEGAFLNRTCFAGANDLTNAQFGDLSRVQSALVKGKFIDEPARVRSWMVEATGAPEKPGESCPAALQVVYMFRKFITPLGAPRRDEVNRGGLLAGRRFPGAPSPDACLDEAVRFGYLCGPDFRDRFRRAEGDKYAEMVSFARDGRISDGIGRLIARLCSRRGCLHRLE